MNEANSLRLFVALPVPDAVRAALKQAQEDLRAVLVPKLASWTKPEAMHLTLRFLGEVRHERIGKLQECLRSAVNGFGELQLVCERLGCFPDLRFPRVIWAWVHDAQDHLAELARRVDAAVTPFAEKPADARFVGHITVARPRALRRAETQALADFVARAVGRQFGSWTARELELICSELSPHGSRYRTIETCQLATHSTA